MRIKGMTLVEVLAATAVLSALLVPILLMMQYSSKAIYRSTNDILATSLAMSKMEELKSYPFFQLENILLGLSANDQSRISGASSTALLRGPFDRNPPEPDIVETSVYTKGDTVFHRYTFLSYFPQANPDPNAKDFDLQKKRIRVRVHIFWKDRLSKTVVIDQDLAFESVVHDENYNPKPLYNKFWNTEG